MTVTYFKRYKMQYNLHRFDFGESEDRESVMANPHCDTLPFNASPWNCVSLPPEFELLAWNRNLLRAHADAKFHSFRLEMDSNLFPCLGDYAGCVRLMHDISVRKSFVREATWLLAQVDRDGGVVEYCGTVQGIRDDDSIGSIQNLGVTPAHRGRGLGTILLRQALLGFRAAGLQKAQLEVTARNVGAVRLYQRLGFRIANTVFKSIELQPV